MALDFLKFFTLSLLTLHFAILVVGQGTQFITGPCTSDANCASGCCGFNTGLCAGPIVAQERDGGCGFGDAQPNDNAARALTGEPPANATASADGIDTNTTASAVLVDAATTASSVATPTGTQFITGPCTGDADCASGCCGFNTGLCAGPVVAQERDGGCGFGDAEPNDNAARALTGGSPASTTASDAGPTASAVGVDTSTTASAVVVEASTTASAVASPTGTQFITGPCTSDADCADGCCGFNTGLCAGPVVAQERDGGCGFGDAQPNDNAARALGFQRKRGITYTA